ncbi:MAG TPA: glycoside hydrolase family 25 protein [Steroidobacteraceae bacterium]|nr:glycoside hydrolase family 25 protein [Steroidobacteraceae bacterium]
MTIQPRVVDLFHGDILYSDVHHTDPVADFRAMGNAGIWGVIHKATQGLGNADPAYMLRTKNARLADLLTGAYHFNTGDTPQGQINHFFDVVEPDAQTMMALDFEDNRASQMTLAEAATFLYLADEKLGRPVWLYGGNRPKELLAGASAEIRALFGKRPWGLPQYASAPNIHDYDGKPMPWANWTLWQFTGDGVGPPPHALPGVITQGIDINTFIGTRAQLTAAWTGADLALAVTS